MTTPPDPIWVAAERAVHMARSFAHDPGASTCLTELGGREWESRARACAYYYARARQLRALPLTIL